MNVISHDRLREDVDRASSGGRADSLRHRLHVASSDTALAPAGVPGDVRE